MKWGLYLTLIFVLFSCKNSTSAEVDVPVCDRMEYALIHCKQETYTEWKIAYMDYVVNCCTDPEEAKQMAKIEADRGEYTFVVYGMITTMEPYENAYLKYPIGFHTAGCDAPEMGEVYNEEMKKYLLKNEGLDYDKIMEEEFAECISCKSKE